MKSLPTKSYFRLARRWVYALGWPGLLGIGSVFFVAAFVLGWAMPLQQRLLAVKQEADVLRAHSVAKSDAKKRLNPAEQLAEFYRFFPKREVLADSMAKLYDAAAQQTLNLDQGEYRLAQERDTRLARYEIVLPVKGGYMQVRKFIAQVLTDLPSLALESIAFNRQKIGEPTVDAQLRFSLYLAAE